MTEQTEYRELTSKEVTLKLDPKSFGFKSTQELEPLTEIVAQPRVVRALELGTGIRHPNYHIYLSGLIGTGRNELITHALRERILDDSILKSPIARWPSVCPPVREFSSARKWKH